MSLYRRGEIWYYLFYLNGKRYRGSAKTNNEKEAARVYAKAMVAAEAGESITTKRAPFIQDFVKEFLEWLDQTTLKPKTKDDYRNGCRLILQSGLCGMRLDQITKDDIEKTRFHESDASRDCGLRTLRRMLSKARDRKLIREIPRVKRPKLAGRDRMVTDTDEQVLLPACPRPLQDVLTIMLDSGLRGTPTAHRDLLYSERWRFLRHLRREATPKGAEASQSAPPFWGEKNGLLVYACGNDALVHQQLDLGSAIFAPPGRSLV